MGLVVDFTASWCPPCKMIAPIFEKLAEENPDVIFIKVDVDEAADVAADQNISGMPTFKFFKNKTKVREFSGADSNHMSPNASKVPLNGRQFGGNYTYEFHYYLEQ